MRHSPAQKLPVTPVILRQLCVFCDALDCPLGRTLKCAFTLAFFGFLRQSNLAPCSLATFDPTRHTCRGDLIVGETDIHIIMKWSKTNQDMRSAPLVPIPAIEDSVVDPVRSFKLMLADTPTISDNEPLLQVPTKRGRRAITVNQLRASLRSLLSACGIDHRLYSLHSFRRGGATAAFTSGASARDIQVHGGWRSSAFWEYIKTLPSDSSVPTALALANGPGADDFSN